MRSEALRRRAIFPGDVRSLGGMASVVRARNQIDSGEPQYCVDYQSRGRDIVWMSPPFADEDQAAAACRAIAQFTGGVVVR